MPATTRKRKVSPAEGIRTDPYFFDEAIRRSTREASARATALSKPTKPRPRRRKKAA